VTRARYDSVPCEHEGLEPYPWGRVLVVLAVVVGLAVAAIRATIQLMQIRG
jgi:hypothetical protein